MSTPSWEYHWPSLLSNVTGSGVGVWWSIVSRSRTKNRTTVRLTAKMNTRKELFAHWSPHTLRKKSVRVSKCGLGSVSSSDDTFCGYRRKKSFHSPLWPPPFFAKSRYSVLFPPAATTCSTLFCLSTETIVSTKQTTHSVKLWHTKY